MLEGAVSGHTPSDEEEASLVARAIQGDETAFARLYDTYHDRIYRYVYCRVRNDQDAEDLTQKVFLLAWRALGRYRRTGSSLVAWLITIAHNVAVSALRSRTWTGGLEQELPETANAADPERALIERIEQERVRRAILRLSSDQQQVITMRFLEDFDYREIAAAMGKSEGNVRVIHHRALQQLRILLARGVG